MTSTIMNYDPNLTNSGNMADQTVELTFQKWDYAATLTVVVGGNCTGFRVIECALEEALEQLGGDEGEITLIQEDGDSREVEFVDTPLEDMLVGARITAIAPRSS